MVHDFGSTHSAEYSNARATGYVGDRPRSPASASCILQRPAQPTAGQLLADLVELARCCRKRLIQTLAHSADADRGANSAVHNPIWHLHSAPRGGTPRARMQSNAVWHSSLSPHTELVRASDVGRGDAGDAGGDACLEAQAPRSTSVATRTARASSTQLAAIIRSTDALEYKCHARRRSARSIAGTRAVHARCTILMQIASLTTSVSSHSSELASARHS